MAKPQTEETLEPLAKLLVAEGKSIVTLAGIKIGGEEVESRHFPGGDHTVVILLEKGYLVKE